MDPEQWPPELTFLHMLVRKYVPGDPRDLVLRLESATEAEWDELNAGIVRLLMPENLKLYQPFVDELGTSEPDENARVLALVRAMMPIRGHRPRQVPR